MNDYTISEDNCLINTLITLLQITVTVMYCCIEKQIQARDIIKMKLWPFLQLHLYISIWFIEYGTSSINLIQILLGPHCMGHLAADTTVS